MLLKSEIVIARAVIRTNISPSIPNNPRSMRLRRCFVDILRSWIGKKFFLAVLAASAVLKS
jgi:hypothetical protein